MLVQLAGFLSIAVGVGAAAPSPLEGRWDLTVATRGGSVPSWLEVRRSGSGTLVGRFVGAFGSARPVGEIVNDANGIRFAIPVQWEAEKGTIEFQGVLEGGNLSGSLNGPFFGGAKVSGVRAPRLATPNHVTWGSPKSLIDAKGLNGWKPTTGWSCSNGILTNDHPGHNLVGLEQFRDFKLHAEFRIPKGSNSGIYLRGRYEVQIDDAFGEEPDVDHIGAIYGFLLPRYNAAREPGKWQRLDVTLLGRRVTVSLNGVTVIDREEIPGITGGALDSDEGEPGPLLLQGDHGPVEFRKLVVTPRVEEGTINR